MLQNMWLLVIERKEFFLDLLWEHLEISLLAIVIAILFGGMIGILISEFQKTAKLTLGAINFLYTIPSISMLGFLIPFSGIGNATAVIALTIYALLPMVRSKRLFVSKKTIAAYFQQKAQYIVISPLRYTTFSIRVCTRS